MSVTIQQVQLLSSIPKIIEFLIYLVLIVYMIQKYKSKPIEQRYILNKLFIIAFICWAAYIFFDIILYILPVARVEALVYNIAKEDALTGYPLDFPELLIAQLMRDIAFIAGFIFIATYLFAAIIIKSGEDAAKNLFKHSKVYIVIYAVIAILSVSNDQISVYKQGLSVVVEERVNTFGGALAILMITVFLMTTSIIIFRTLSKLGKNDNQLRKRSLLIGIGIFLKGIGAVYWIIFGLARTNIDVTQYPLQILLFMFIGHTLWIISPILIFLGLKSADNSNK